MAPAKWVMFARRVARYWAPPLLAVALFTSSAFGRDKIVWMVNGTFPPAHIPSGDYKGQGVVDIELAWLISRLPQFEHSVVESNATRNFHEIAERDGVCEPAALDTPERRKVAVFSRPVIVSEGARLLVRNDRLKELSGLLTTEGDIKLETLTQIKDLKGLINLGRHYNPVISEFLADHPQQTLLRPVSNSDQAFQILNARRADFVVGYPIELAFYKKSKRSDVAITPLPIKGVTPLVKAYVACSNAQLGRSVVKAIDKVLGSSASPPPYMAATRQWHTDIGYDLITDPALWADR